MEMSRLTRDGTAKPVSRGQILRRERGQGKNTFSHCLADHEKAWQLYPIDPYSAESADDTYNNVFRPQIQFASISTKKTLQWFSIFIEQSVGHSVEVHIEFCGSPLGVRR